MQMLRCLYMTYEGKIQWNVNFGEQIHKRCYLYHSRGINNYKIIRLQPPLICGDATLGSRGHQRYHPGVSRIRQWPQPLYYGRYQTFHSPFEYTLAFPQASWYRSWHLRIGLLGSHQQPFHPHTSTNVYSNGE